MKDNHSKMHSQKGFTMIELLIVIGLMGVMASIALAILNPLEQIRKANDSRRKSDLEQLQRGLELYYQDNGKYPLSSVNYRISVNAVTINWGTAWQPYISKVPSDPVATRTYVYYSAAAANGQSYYLYANLERGSRDSQACNAGAACPNVPGGVTCGGGSACNFGLSSSNVSP
jgi:general secretion pathway protein G